MNVAKKMIGDCFGEFVDRNSSVVVPIKNRQLIGRAQGYNINKMSNDHFMVSVSNQVVCIIDLEATNGTYINNKRIEPNLTYPIRHGDIIRAGDSEFIVNFFSDGYKPIRPLQISEYFDFASFGQRTLAFLIDICLVILLSLVFFNYHGLDKIKTLKVMEYAFIIFLSHFIAVQIPTILYSRSVGKTLLGIKILNKDGDGIGVSTVFLREIIFKIVMMFSLPFIGYIFLNSKNPWLGGAVLAFYFIAHPVKYFTQGEAFWDDWCNTYVIETKPAKRKLE